MLVHAITANAAYEFASEFAADVRAGLDPAGAERTSRRSISTTT